MSRPYYERLSALDASMVFMETANTHMHVGAVGIFETGPLATPEGGIDIERIRSHIDGALDDIPHHRQRLAFIPLEQHPVWVDDDRFNLSYHVHHTCLPRPGSIRQLKRLVGRIVSQKLDASKPLWELWFVEGLEGNRFAVVNKMHHCMVDGISAINVMAGLLSPNADAPKRRPSTWHARPAPSSTALVTGELQRRAGVPFALLRGVATALRDPERAAVALRDAAQGAVEVVRGKLHPATTTPLNPDAIGPHRRFDWVRFDLDDAKAVKRRLGGKVNDVVLATVAGAVRRYLQAHHVSVSGLDFRVTVPVNTRSAAEQGALGNRVVPMLARLPLEMRNPRGRLQHVMATTQALKASKEVHAVELFEDVSNWADAALLSEVVRRATRWWAGNMIVTNVPGPPLPYYLLGARLLECYPLVPIMANQAVGIAVLSYAGGLFWGFNSDWDAVPDLHDFVQCVADEFAALKQAATREHAVHIGSRHGKVRRGA